MGKYPSKKQFPLMGITETGIRTQNLVLAMELKLPDLSH